ncbi:MAG: MoxR family ATPase [Acidimicrobiia bacterium]|nr:MAG: MoxR family ATPase [Acidimicrobiia bacterium]
MSLSPDDLAWFDDRFQTVTKNIERVIQGKKSTIELVVASLVAEGHVLIEDVPGVGKTLLAKSLARSIDCTFQRIQFTPDLLPSDVTGVSVWDRELGTFRFRPGPVFANVLLGDEINRASPKTQAALLEAMEERQVTVDAETRELDPPFIVIATQNPIEHEGTYPLPEAQLDRFMMRVIMGYPDRAKELEMLETHGAKSSFEDLKPVIHAEDVVRMSSIARDVHVADVLRGYLIDLAETTRNHPDLLLGASPRATLYLQRAARTMAAADGRDYASPDDVKAILNPVLNHRLVIRPEAQMRGITANDVIDQIVATVPVPGTRTNA